MYPHKFGIVETPLEGKYGYGLPLHCYRLRGVNNSSPQPSPLPNPGTGGIEHIVKSYGETGRFTANQVVNIHNSCSKSSAVAAILNSGDSVYYDSVYITNKYMYISYVSYSGVRRYVPICTYSNGVKGPISGTIG
ncbi:SH3 domain-containing protein [Facklamia hominis]|uniref:SH3 domain-containing protein n=1 Tax=Facklamia hominis TaxID=178214 RepID=A0AAJ1V292_9LACT|nr:SH3 domain-containing protein [Facklamia hominis]MDK7187280.1 SH3 domain-containing protein [Facklamia hominis]